jgi:hypothetical protein
VLTQSSVETELRRLIDAAEDVAHDVGDRAEAAGRAEHAYKVGFARAYLRADGPVASREAQALLAVDELHLARKVAEARLLAAQETARTIRSNVDALRSLNVTVRHATVLDW